MKSTTSAVSTPPTRGYALLRDSRGGLYVGTRGGLAYFAAGADSPREFPPLATHQVNALVADPGGTVWVRYNLSEVLPAPTPMATMDSPRAMSTIASVRATAVNVPMVAPYRFSFGRLASFTSTIVEVVDADDVMPTGIVSWGNLQRGAGLEITKRVF